MRIRRFTVLLMFLCTNLHTWAQTTISPDTPGSGKSGKRGWEVSGNFGYFMASSYQAAFYNGSPKNVNNLDYVFSNKYWRDEIDNLFLENTDRDSFLLVAYPGKMKYNGAMMAGLSARYNFSRAWALNFHFNFVKLYAEDFVSYQLYPPYSGEVESYVNFPIYGSETRSNIDVAVMHAFKPYKDFSPIAEIGINLNSTHVKKSAIRVFEQEYNMVDVYGSGGYVPGSGNTEYVVDQGGLGFGLYTSAGLRYSMTRDFSMELAGIFYYSKINLEGYPDFSMHYGAILRLVVNPFMFGNNDYTNPQ